MNKKDRRIIKLLDSLFFSLVIFGAAVLTYGVYIKFGPHLFASPSLSLTCSKVQGSSSSSTAMFNTLTELSNSFSRQAYMITLVPSNNVMICYKAN